MDIKDESSAFFQLITQKGVIFNFKALSVQEKHVWIRSIENAILNASIKNNRKIISGSNSNSCLIRTSKPKITPDNSLIEGIDRNIRYLEYLNCVISYGNYCSTNLYHFIKKEIF